MSTPDRREFLKTTATGAALAGATAFASTARAAGANERLVVGVIGPGGMGSNHVKLLSENKAVDVA
jgi:D-arabinose 1-dehydrogenase-like Zn-dependent alcohol dehydrogenase